MLIKLVSAAVLALLSLSAHAYQLVRLEVDRHADVYTVYVVMDFDLPAQSIRAVLTDYAHLDRINDSITSSEIIGAQQNGALRVRTRFRNCVLFFCRRLQKVEDITEDEQGRIKVVIVPGSSNFRSGQASWEVRSTRSGSRVIHRATLEPDLWIPPWMGTAILKNALRREIEKSFEGLARKSHQPGSG